MAKFYHKNIYQNPKKSDIRKFRMGYPSKNRTDWM